MLQNPTDGLPQEKDLAYRAAEALLPYRKTEQGVDIRLDKQIPSGGGLGGGSSDAATVLLVLNRWWQCGLTRQQLINIGVGLGADVPFFLFGKNAFAKGIGEKLTEINVPQQWYIVVKPPVHVSTAAIFSHKDLTRDSVACIMPTFANLQPSRNDMQAVVLQVYPEIMQIYKDLQQFGQVMMTGSGACLFLTFHNYKDAQIVYSKVSSKYQSRLVQGLQQHPLYGLI